MPERVTYHVAPDGASGWTVKKEGARRTSATAATKQEAVARAKQLAKQQALGQVVVHGRDGAIQTEWTYGKDPIRHPG